MSPLKRNIALKKRQVAFLFACSVLQACGGGSGNSAADSSTVVEKQNSAPSITGSPVSQVTVGQTYSFTPQTTDPENDNLEFSISGKPAWASFSTSTGTLSGTPDTSGQHTGIRIQVSDGKATAELGSFDITVKAAPVSAPPAHIPNQPPVISGTPVNFVVSGDPFSFTPTASDPEGDPLTFTINNRPVWASFNSTNGRLSGTPSNANAGFYNNIVIRVSDGTDQTALAAFTLEVRAQATGSATLHWTPPNQYKDGSPLTQLAGYRIYYGTSVGSYPGSVTIADPAATQGVVSGLAPGRYYFVVRAYDSRNSESDDSAFMSKVIP